MLGNKYENVKVRKRVKAESIKQTLTKMRATICVLIRSGSNCNKHTHTPTNQFSANSLVLHLISLTIKNKKTKKQKKKTQTTQTHQLSVFTNSSYTQNERKLPDKGEEGIDLHQDCMFVKTPTIIIKIKSTSFIIRFSKPTLLTLL